jgi:cation diffusion facilitator CzcD-associated flavoprotein CzcO
LLGSRRPIKAIVIGFGMSGINLSYILGKQIKGSNITLQFYDRNPELGGTWFENR